MAAAASSSSEAGRTTANAQPATVMYFKDDGRPAILAAASPSLTHPTPSHDDDVGRARHGAIQDDTAAGTSRMVQPQPQPPSADADARAVSPLPLHTSVPTMPEEKSATVILSPHSTTDADADADANATDGQEGHVPLRASSSSSSSTTAPPPALLQRTSSAARRQMTEDFDPSSHDALYDAIPGRLREGTAMLKVSAKKVQRRMVKLKAEAGQVLWESKHAGMLNIESIRELRFASDARAFREQFKVAPDSEPRWITIIYTSAGKYKVLHLVALTLDDFRLWRQTLGTLYDQRKELMGGLDQMRKRHAVWLKQHWSNADADADQRLSLKDVAALCRNLNISAADRDIQTNFERADTHKRGFLDFADFQVFVKHLRRRQEVEKVMLSVAGNTDRVPLANFKCFLKTTQRSTLPEATLDALYAKFSDAVPGTSRDSSIAAERVMTMEGFTSFLMSSDNSGFSERQLRVCDDMTRPLCEYYISSSHNTYLIGGQLKGESTSEGYIRALQQGCRSVELDVWDGPDEPLIYHGRTLTSKLPARDALLAIAKYAFVASPYPVILSMEVHCDQEQQDKLAEILRSSLGSALIDAPLFGEEAVEAHAGCPKVDALPSPEELKYRILVKAKNLYVVQAAQKIEEPELESESSSSSSSQSSDSDLKRVFSSALRKIRPGASPDLPSPSPPNSTAAKPNPFSWGSPPNPNLTPSERQQPTSSLAVVGAVPVPPGTGAPLERKTSASVKEGRRVSLARVRSRSDRSDTAPLVSSALASGKEKPLMSLALAALIVYTVGVKWRGFNKKEQYGASHVISLGERRAMKTIKEARTDLVAHCRTHLLRAYPAGRRFTSSNYTPLPFWAAGVQLAALNWQTYDLGTELNAAFFQRNGRSGYVLKPGLLRAKKAEEKDKEALARVERYILMVEVLSAQQLPRPQGSSDGGGGGGDAGADAPRSVPMNPFVEVAVHTPTVASGDVAKYTTPVVWGNGFNPVFDSKYQIPFTVPPDMLDLAFLRLEVMVKLGGDEMSLGKYSVSLPVLMPGYRHVPLYDHLGQQYLFSSLFIYTQLQKQPS